MKITRLVFASALILALQLTWFTGRAHGQSTSSNSIHGGNLSVEVFDDGSYALRSTAIQDDVLRSEVEIDTAAGTLKSSLYPRHTNSITPFTDELGSGHLLTVTHTGLPGTPDLICEFRVYDDQPWGDIKVSISNTTGSPIEMHAIRVVKSSKDDIVKLNGPASADRVLSDDYTENPVRLMDLGEPKDGIHLGFRSQLIYNQKSAQSLFLGALTEDKLLTGFHLLSTVGPDAHMLSYEVSDTGTNIVQDENAHYTSGKLSPFSLQAAAGANISSERLMFAIGSDYHAQLENYGRAIRILHKARVTTPTLMGWWSWTAYYYGVTQNTVIANADWLAQNLKPFGYNYCFVDEGYQYARGEYATADGKAFPNGMGYVTHHAENEGLTFGLWVAPFEMSELSYVYQHHKDWLVHNLAGELIHIGKAGGNKNADELYALDTTNPGAQEYIRYTYSTLVKDWGVRLIKMDFMDSSAIEGVHYRPNTTALEALRIGLETIRSAVGDDVILDKDGSFMLTPVGIVDTGRIGQDTGHSFRFTRDAAPGIAARYFMNRNFYLSDPDAFTVSKQVVNDTSWRGNKVPLTLEEAESSIALSAISGGMFEIGDDLPTLGESPDRVALVKNPDLLDMARLSRASIPVDLMTYRPEDKQPSIFFLKETPRQQILTVFNWTTDPSSHTFALSDLGLKASDSYTATNVLRGGAITIENGALSITLPPHSVRMIKLIDTSVPETDPVFKAYSPSTAQAGDLAAFHATAGNADAPVLEYQWEFGDGVSADGASVSHAYTHSGQYTVTATATGLSGRKSQKTLTIAVTGMVPASYRPYERTRYIEGK